jgi:3-hydroxybutyryl-CoA dehydratase
MSEKLKFADVTIGTRLPEHKRRVAQEDFDRMAVASLDYNPVHVNPAWAKRAKVFGIEPTVAHGMMTMSFQGSMIADWLYPLGGELRLMDSKFTKPVPPGDTVTSTGEVIEIHYTGKNQGYIVVAMTSVNQRGETVAAGRAEVVIP